MTAALGERTDRRWRVWSAALAVCSVVAVTAVLWDESVRSRIDFHIYVEAVRAGARGSVYDFSFPGIGLGFTYPPFAYVVMWPLSQLSTAVGEHLWLGVSLVCSTGFLAVVGAELAPILAARWPASPWTDRRVAAAGMVAAGIWTMPVMLNARIGQVNALLAGAIALDIVLLRRRRAAAGVGTGFATAVKLVPGVLIPFYWLSGRRRAAATAVITTAVATAIAWAVRPADTVRYFGTEVWATGRVGGLDSGYSNAMRRAVEWLPIGGGLRTLLWAVLAAVVLVVGYRRAVRADRHGSLLTGVTFVMVAGYLVSPITWGHHLFFMVPAVALWLAGARRSWQWALGALMVVALYDPIAMGNGPVTAALRIGLLAVLLFGLPSEPRIDVMDDPPMAGSPSAQLRGTGTR